MPDGIFRLFCRISDGFNHPHFVNFTPSAGGDLNHHTSVSLLQGTYGTGSVLDPHSLNADPNPGFFSMRMRIRILVKISVLDPHSFNADPDPGFFFNADPDPDPDPDPG